LSIFPTSKYSTLILFSQLGVGHPNGKNKQLCLKLFKLYVVTDALRHLCYGKTRYLRNINTPSPKIGLEVGVFVPVSLGSAEVSRGLRAAEIIVVVVVLWQ
jgi:hypothetical protein